MDEEYRRAYSARMAGVEDLAPQGSVHRHQVHRDCGDRLRIGKRRGDGALVYWCVGCEVITRVLDRAAEE